jgi:hypothetical protein
MAFHELPHPRQSRKLSSSQGHQITAIACNTAPEGRSHLTLELLREEAIRKGIVDDQSVFSRKNMVSNCGKRKMWCIPPCDNCLEEEAESQESTNQLEVYQGKGTRQIQTLDL